jgi:site-specific DNA recombinase
VESDIIDSFMKMLHECKYDSDVGFLIDENIKQKRLTSKDKNRLLHLEDEIQKRYQELYRVVEKGGKWRRYI